MQALILDLRSNGGGNLSTCIDIANQLLPKGLIVYTEDKYGNREEYTCDGKHRFDKPMVVLVNGYSASASEILTGAIKDHGIGTIMGTTTYGKGIVQQIMSLKDGTAVKMTISKYYTPNGNYIHDIGIEPDIEVEFDSDAYKKDKTDNQLDAAKEQIKKMMRD
jgi:carboxyl-terminal processing protease